MTGSINHLKRADHSIFGSSASGRTCELVLKSIAYSPQESEGSPLLIADKLLRDLGKPGALTLMDMGHIKPDPIRDTQYVADVHLHMGINYALRPERVVAFEYSFALEALYAIRAAAVEHARALGITLPDGLDRDLAEYKMGDIDPQPVKIRHDVIVLLYRTLLDDTRLASAVREDIGARAQRVRDFAHEQRRASAEKGRRMHPAH